MKMLLVFITLFSFSSCALIDQINNPEKYAKKPHEWDRFDAMKFKEDNRSICDEFNKEDTYKKFSEVLCVNKSKGECKSDYEKTAKARMFEKYKLADARKIGDICAAHPIECADLYFVEKLMVNSHNSGADILREKNEAGLIRRDRERTFGLPPTVTTECQKDGSETVCQSY